MGKKSKDDAKAKKQKSGGTLPMLLIIPTIIILIVFLKATFILILLGMLPSIVAFYADTTEDKMGVATVTCCNLSGVLPDVMRLHEANHSWELLTYYLSNSNTWLMMYGMAALGYALIKLCPYMFNITLRTINTSKIFQLQQKQDALVKEWGESIKQLPEV